MTNTLTAVTPQHLADEFSKVLRSWFKPAEWNEMVALNATPEFANGLCCASHNYCDASMAMLEALENLEISAEFDPARDADCRLWNEAWDIARSGWRKS